MALVLFEKPAAPERIPANRDNSPALRFDFVLDPALVDEMHDDANRQAGTNDKEVNLVGSMQRLRPIVAHPVSQGKWLAGADSEAESQERSFCRSQQKIK